MIDLETHGFTKLTWEGNIPSPMPVPNVPYWASGLTFADWVSGVVWRPNYDGKGNGGFFTMADFDGYLTRGGKWAWDISLEIVDDIYEPIRPCTNYTYIKRIPSPLPEELLITVL